MLQFVVALRFCRAIRSGSISNGLNPVDNYLMPRQPCPGRGGDFPGKYPVNDRRRFPGAGRCAGNRGASEAPPCRRIRRGAGTRRGCVTKGRGRAFRTGTVAGKGNSRRRRPNPQRNPRSPRDPRCREARPRRRSKDRRRRGFCFPSSPSFHRNRFQHRDLLGVEEIPPVNIYGFSSERGVEQASAPAGRARLPASAQSAASPSRPLLVQRRPCPCAG